MRGSDKVSGSLFSYVDIEDRIPASHPLREVRAIVNKALAALDTEFAKLYAADGRPSIAPERLLRAALLQILFSIRSERQLMEQMQYNLLFRWFVGLGVDDPVWVPTVFTKNRDRLLTTHIARKFLATILSDKAVTPLLSEEHFSVDGTLIEAWASMKSFKPKAEADGAEPPAGEAGSGGGATRAGEGSNAEPLTPWLWHEMNAPGLPVVCMDAHHAHAILSTMRNKTDGNDAQKLAELVLKDMYLEVKVKRAVGTDSVNLYRYSSNILK